MKRAQLMDELLRVTRYPELRARFAPAWTGCGSLVKTVFHEKFENIRIFMESDRFSRYTA